MDKDLEQTQNSNKKGISSSESSLQNLDQILKPLANPSRQQLLLILAEGPITYTEILQRMGIESGSFYWHIGKMQILVDQTELKEYKLSNLGRKAYELLVFDGKEEVISSPFRPDWYVNLFTIFNRLYQLPTWILLQQVVIILGLTIYIFQANNILQAGTIPFEASSYPGLLPIVISVLGSVLVISISILISQILYIQPDKEYFRKSLFPLFVRIMLTTLFTLMTGLILSALMQLGFVTLANNPIFQFVISMSTLLVTIISTTVMVDLYLDLGLKDGLLIVLPTYYTLVLITTFLIQIV